MHCASKSRRALSWRVSAGTGEDAGHSLPCEWGVSPSELRNLSRQNSVQNQAGTYRNFEELVGGAASRGHLRVEVKVTFGETTNRPAMREFFVAERGPDGSYRQIHLDSDGSRTFVRSGEPAAKVVFVNFDSRAKKFVIEFRKFLKSFELTGSLYCRIQIGRSL